MQPTSEDGPRAVEGTGQQETLARFLGGFRYVLLRVGICDAIRTLGEGKVAPHLATLFLL